VASKPAFNPSSVIMRLVAPLALAAAVQAAVLGLQHLECPVDCQHEAFLIQELRSIPAAVRFCSVLVPEATTTIHTLVTTSTTDTLSSPTTTVTTLTGGDAGTTTVTVSSTESDTATM
jgi:hypothetical protein